MTTKITTTLAFETDTELARLYNARAAAEHKLEQQQTTQRHMAGAEFFYRGRRRVTNMSAEEAHEKVALLVAAADGTDLYGYGRVGGTSYSMDQARTTIARTIELNAELAQIAEDMKAGEAIFAEHRWTRFFLVTSSAGHIHSSMHCGTCRPTTAYGWLPELSGKTEKDAVKAHGETLCSVCFASAPVAWQGGRITKAAAAKAAA